MVTDAVPELMSKREGRLLSLGLRARVSVLKWINHVYSNTNYAIRDSTKGYHGNIQIVN